MRVSVVMTHMFGEETEETEKAEEEGYGAYR